MKDLEAMAQRRNSKRKAEYDDDTPGQFEVTYQPKHCGVYNIYLFGAIVDPAQFIGAIEVMSRATEDDLVIVNLQTPGGSVDATDTFISAMRECEADVIVKASGGVHSAGTIILMNAQMFQLSRNFNALVHNGSVGTGGKFSDFRIDAKFNTAKMEEMLRTTYEGFLNPKELDELIAGKDFWLDGKAFSERFTQRQEFLKAKYGDQVKQLTQELVEEIESAPATKPARKTRKKTSQA